MFQGVTASVVVLLGDITSVLGAYSFFRAFGETAAILGIFKLRRKFPSSADTYVVGPYPFIINRQDRIKQE